MSKKADDTAPPLKTSEEPATIKTAQVALAARLKARTAPSAKQGDIFTPEIAAHFRRLLRPEVKEKGTKEAIHDDNPGPFRSRSTPVYPENEPLSTVPPNVLKTLPPLPE